MHAEIDIYHGRWSTGGVRRSGSRRRPRSSSSHRSHRHRSSHSRSSRRTLTGILLWSTLSLVTAAYVTFLALTALRHPAAKQDTLSAAATDNSSATVSRQDETQALEALATNIESLIERHTEAEKILDIASALIKDDQLGSAAGRLETLLAAGMHFNSIRMKLAQIYRLQKRFDEATHLLMDVLATQPDMAAARLLLARVLLEARHWEPALQVDIGGRPLQRRRARSGRPRLYRYGAAGLGDSPPAQAGCAAAR